MYEVETPNVAFTGIRCGTAIVDGKGRTDDQDTACELLALSYKVTPDPTPEDRKPKSKAQIAAEKKAEEQRLAEEKAKQQQQ